MKAAGPSGTLEPYFERGPEYEVFRYSDLRERLRASQRLDSFVIEEKIARLLSARSAVRAALSPRKVPAANRNSTSVAAVDAGFNGRGMLIGYYPTILAVGALFRGTKRVDEPIAATARLPRDDLDEEEARKLASLIGFYLQFELGRMLLGSDPDVLVSDGSLMLRRSRYSPLGRAYGDPYLDAYREANVSLVRMLAEARDSGIPAVGLVKRVGSRAIGRALGIAGVPDSAAASLVLEPGEYLGPLELDREAEEVAGWAAEAGVDPDGLEPVAYFYRPGGGTAVRLDVPRYASASVERVVGILSALAAPGSSLPLPLVAVDRLTRVTDREASEAYLRTVAGVLRRAGADALKFLAVLALRHGERI